MKVYIEKYDIKNVPMDALEHYTLEKKYKTNIYSEEGIFSIENQKIYKLIPVSDEDVETIYLNEYPSIPLLVDKSSHRKEEYSQIPPDHISEEIVQFIFRNSKVRLIVEERNYIPINLFFEIRKEESIDQIMIQREIGEFLFALK